MAYGLRIKFIKKDNELVSYKVYTSTGGVQQARVHIDPVALTYKIIDPVDGKILAENRRTYTNLEVVQRNAKKDLQKILEIQFDKEERKVETNE